MQWSKLKSRVKSRICPELRDRIDFYATAYRRAHDDVERVWITIDGKPVFTCKYYLHNRASAEAFISGLHGDAIKSMLRVVEIHNPKDFGTSMRSYLDLSIADALASENPLIKAFAIVDRRLGKRSLTKLELSPADHSLVKAFYHLRFQAVAGIR